MPPTDCDKVCFRPESLAVLEKCIRRLARDGGIFEGDLTGLWNDTIDDHLESSIPVDSSIERTRRSVAEIQTLKSLSKGLLDLKNRLDTFITTRTEEILPATRHHGLATLPDEVLILVFEQLLGLHKNRFVGSRVVIRDLSLVCRRFRECILTSAEFWTNLDLTLCGSGSVDLFLERSKNRSLSVLFDMQHNIDAVVSTCSHRLRSIWVDLTDTDQCLCPSLDIPSVEELFVVGLRKWTSPSWPFPNAERADIGDGIPGPASFSYESLETLTLRTDTSHDGEDAPTFDGAFLTKLVNFLQPAVSLRALHLHLVFGDAKYYGAALTVELPNVREFSISNEGSPDIPEYSDSDDYGVGGWWDLDDRPDPFIEISRLFKLPNVRDVSVSLEFQGDKFCLMTWLNWALPHLRESRSVESLAFHVQSEPSKNTVQIGEFFRFFPSLRYLTLDTFADTYCSLSFRMPFGLNGESALNLEYLRLGFRNSENMVDMYRMLGALAERGAPLRKVHIRSPYAFDVARLEGILPEADICVTTVDDGVY